MTSFDDEELDDLPEWLDLDFRTVDSYQGAEADIVIISMTRTDEYRFTDDLNRLNLVLTRARQLRIVVGDEELLVGDKQKARDLRAPRDVEAADRRCSIIKCVDAGHGYLATAIRPGTQPGLTQSASRPCSVTRTPVVPPVPPAPPVPHCPAFTSHTAVSCLLSPYFPYK